jgi:hypothetical protein
MNAEGLPGQTSWQKFTRQTGRRLFPLDGPSLCAMAMRRTGLKDFGTPGIEPAFSILTRSLEQEAQLHPLGRFLMRSHLLGLLETRLRLADAWREDWATLDASPLQRPVFIIGMPRSGSTFLHEILAEDPANRSPRVWEVMFPVAGPGHPAGDRRRRLRKAAFCLWWFRRLAPEADSVYPMRANTPHECVAIQSYTLLSEEFVSTCHVPSYKEYLRAADLSLAYAWEKRFLQMLQWGEAARRWVLKSPDHVHGLNELFAVFPDAVVIQTHRDPMQVLKSSAELTRVLRGLYGPPGTHEQLAINEAQALAHGTERSLQFRDEHPELAGRFIDVKYSDLVKDPLAAVAQIYRRLEVPLSAEAEERMRRLATSRARYQWRGRRPQETSQPLASAMERSLFAHYCSRFGLSDGERARG